MKEQIRPFQSELTINSNPPTLDVRGPRMERGRDIFMPEPGNGETQQTPREPHKAKVELPQIEKVRKEWDEFNKGKTLTPEDLRKQRSMIALGIKPSSEKRDPDEEWMKKEIEKKLEESERLGAPVIVGASDTDPNGEDATPEVEFVAVDEKKEASQTAAGAGGEGGEPPEEPPTATAAPGESEDNENGLSAPSRLDPASFEDEAFRNMAYELDTQLTLVGRKGVLPEDYIQNLRNETRRILSDDALRTREGLTDEELRRINTRRIEAERLMEELNLRAKETQTKYREQNVRGRLAELTTEHSVKDLLTNRKARDQVFNDIFAGVDSTPHEFFQTAFNQLTHGMRYEAFMDIIRNGSVGRFEQGVDEGWTPEQKSQYAKELAEDFQRYQLERRNRETLHNMNAILYLPGVNLEQLMENMQRFGSELGDFTVRQAGVPEMMNIYEAVLREGMMKNNGYLRPEEVEGYIRVEVGEDGNPRTVYKMAETEEKTKARFKSMLRKGLIVMKTEDGESKVVDANMPDWEIDRRFTTARAMMIVSERLISIAAESKLPKGGVYTSLFLQDILQSYSPYIHLLMKYSVTESGLAAYLRSDDQSIGFKKGMGGRKIMEFMGVFSPAELEKALKMAEEDPAGLLQSSEFKYLMRQNPNMAGDIFTWVSWRLGDDPDEWTMSKEFLQAGKGRMEGRWGDNDIHKPLKPENNISGEPYTDEQWRKDYENEYANWIGTSVRFERLRWSLSSFDSKDPKLKEKFRKALPRATQILNRMADLQPHRLFTVSKDIRARVGHRFLGVDKDVEFTEEHWKKIEQVLEDLNIVERSMLDKREEILDKGKTFNTMSLANTDLNDPEFDFFNSIEVTAEDAPNATPEERMEMTKLRRENARAFAQLIRQDFATNSNDYLNEFIYNREYTHGFALWSGDVPINEFRMSILGKTGIARRARDNKAQSEAAAAEIELLGNLNKIHTQDQLVDGLEKIKNHISAYDSGKAKRAITDKALGLIKFYSSDWSTQIPIIGPALAKFRRTSMAQIVYGKEMPSWQPIEVTNFIMKLKNRGLITKAQAKELASHGGGRPFDVSRDAAVTIAQLIVIAMTLYMFEELTKERRS
ncbi:MAG: hypothetical protein AAB531_04635 [Patescibacteria group bacterium]